MSRYGCTIFVGNLPGDVREREVEDLFYKVCNVQPQLLACHLRDNGPGSRFEKL